MHISDGILSAGACLGTIAVASAVTLYSLKKTSNRDIPRLSMMTAAFFVASLIHVRIGPSSVHLVLNGVMGIVLGISSFPAILVGLLLQSILFQEGGITALGANSLAMGIPAFCSFAIFSLSRLFSSGAGWLSYLLAFLAGFAAIALSSVFIAGFLYLSGSEFYTTAKIIVMAHLPLAAVEGLITAIIIRFIGRIKPELIKRNFAGN